MARVTKAMQVEEYCNKLRTELGFERAQYDYEEWNTLKVLDGGQFHFNNEENIYAFYGFREELSAACVRGLGSCRSKRLMNEYLASVWFNIPLSESAVWAHMNGQNGQLPAAYANCTKLIPIERALFRDMDVNEAGMFEMDLTPSYHEELDLRSGELPQKVGKATFPIRLRLSGGLPTGPVPFTINEARRSYEVAFSCGGEQYGFYAHAEEQKPIVSIKKWRARKDDEGAFLDVIMEMDFYHSRCWD